MADRGALEQLSRERPAYPSAFLSPPALVDFFVQGIGQALEADPKEVEVWLALREQKLVGYLLLILRTKESITEQLQTQVQDYIAPDFEVMQALLDEAAQSARRVQAEYLVIHLSSAAHREKLWCYRLGFRAELNRVVKSIAAGHSGSVSPQYLARPARANEHLFLLRVNAEYSWAYRPAGRDTDLQAISAGFLDCYINLKLDAPGMHFIILEEVQSRRQAGYIILIEYELPPDHGPRLAYYTYDVAVAPEFAGRGLSLYLCGAAESVLGQRGGGLLFGDTSLSNVAAVNGDRQLGFQIDSQRFGLRM